MNVEIHPDAPTYAVAAMARHLGAEVRYEGGSRYLHRRAVEVAYRPRTEPLTWWSRLARRIRRTR